MIAPFNMLALGLGPLLASLCFDISGSYSIAFGIFSATYLASSFLLWLARKPVRPEAAAPKLTQAVAAGG